jgi:hypothetical protein
MFVWIIVAVLLMIIVIREVLVRVEYKNKDLRIAFYKREAQEYYDKWMRDK